MPQSLSSVLIHLIYSTKNREPFITAAVQPELFAYMSMVFHVCNSPALSIGGTADHVHSLFALGRTVTIAEVGRSEEAQFEMDQDQRPGIQDVSLANGLWRIFDRSVERVGPERYIRDQADYHRHRSFQDEYRTFLKRYGIEYDERYVWD